MKNISVLVSGGGTNLQAIIDAMETGKLANCRIAQIISSKSDAYAVERGRQHNIKTVIIDKQREKEMFGSRLNECLDRENTDLVVLAGYLTVLPKEVVEKYSGKIINIHPSLIPKYSGKGFYGMRVHKAVLESGEKETGATVHYVDEGIDTGQIIIQKKIDISGSDSAEDIAGKVLKIEHEILVKAIEKVLGIERRV